MGKNENTLPFFLPKEACFPHAGAILKGLRRVLCSCTFITRSLDPISKSNPNTSKNPYNLNNFKTAPAWDKPYCPKIIIYILKKSTKSKSQALRLTEVRCQLFLPTGLRLHLILAHQLSLQVNSAEILPISDHTCFPFGSPRCARLHEVDGREKNTKIRDTTTAHTTPAHLVTSSSCALPTPTQYITRHKPFGAMPTTDFVTAAKAQNCSTEYFPNFLLI